MVVWCFQPNYYCIHFHYAIDQWKNIFQKLKSCPTHLLMSFNSIRIMAGNMFQSPKSLYRVIGYGWLVIPEKPLLYSPLVGYYSMENHFSELKNTSNLFTYELQ